MIKNNFFKKTMVVGLMAISMLIPLLSNNKNISSLNNENEVTLNQNIKSEYASAEIISVEKDSFYSDGLYEISVNYKIDLAPGLNYSSADIYYGDDQESLIRLVQASGSVQTEENVHVYLVEGFIESIGRKFDLGKLWIRLFYTNEDGYLLNEYFAPTLFGEIEIPEFPTEPVIYAKINSISIDTTYIEHHTWAKVEFDTQETNNYLSKFDSAFVHYTNYNTGKKWSFGTFTVNDGLVYGLLNHDFFGKYMNLSWFSLVIEDNLGFSTESSSKLDGRIYVPFPT